MDNKNIENSNLVLDDGVKKLSKKDQKMLNRQKYTSKGSREDTAEVEPTRAVVPAFVKNNEKDMELPEDFVYNPNIEDSIPNIADTEEGLPDGKKLPLSKRNFMYIKDITDEALRDFEGGVPFPKRLPDTNSYKAWIKERNIKYKKDEFKKLKQEVNKTLAEESKKKGKGVVKKQEQQVTPPKTRVSTEELSKETVEAKKKLMEFEYLTFLKKSQNFEFLDRVAKTKDGKMERVVDKDYLRHDYTKSIHYLISYLEEAKASKIVNQIKESGRNEKIIKEYYTFSDEDIAGKLGDTKVKIIMRGAEKEMHLRDLIKLGDQRMLMAIRNSHNALMHMKEANIKNFSDKVGNILLQDFPKVEIDGKKQTNIIPWEMAFVVARGYYNMDSFASYNPENGAISFVCAREDVVQKIWKEVVALVPDFPKPEGKKLLSPEKDPEIMAKIRTSISKEKWLEILNIKGKNYGNVSETAREETKEKSPEAANEKLQKKLEEYKANQEKATEIIRKREEIQKKLEELNK